MGSSPRFRFSCNGRKLPKVLFTAVEDVTISKMGSTPPRKEFATNFSLRVDHRRTKAKRSTVAPLDSVSIQFKGILEN